MGNIEKGEEKTEGHKTVVCTIINICVGESISKPWPHGIKWSTARNAPRMQGILWFTSVASCNLELKQKEEIWHFWGRKVSFYNCWYLVIETVALFSKTWTFSFCLPTRHIFLRKTDMNQRINLLWPNYFDKNPSKIFSNTCFYL